MALSDELEALAKRHGATSYRNRADTQHPAYGFTEDGLNGLIDEVLEKWGTPPAVAGEPYGYVYTVQVAPIVGDERKVERTVFTRNKPTCKALPLYTQPQAGVVPTREFLERTLAAMEGVIDVADRKTDEFDALRSCVIDLTLMLFSDAKRHTKEADHER